MARRLLTPLVLLAALVVGTGSAQAAPTHQVGGARSILYAKAPAPGPLFADPGPVRLDTAGGADGVTVTQVDRASGSVLAAQTVPLGAPGAWRVERAQVVDGVVAVEALAYVACRACTDRGEDGVRPEVSALLAGAVGGPLELIARDDLDRVGRRSWVVTGGEVVSVAPTSVVTGSPAAAGSGLEVFRPGAGVTALPAGQHGLSGLQPDLDGQGVLVVDGGGTDAARLLGRRAGGAVTELQATPGLQRVVPLSGDRVLRTYADGERDVSTRDGRWTRARLRSFPLDPLVDDAGRFWFSLPDGVHISEPDGTERVVGTPGEVLTGRFLAPEQAEARLRVADRFLAPEYVAAQGLDGPAVPLTWASAAAPAVTVVGGEIEVRETAGDRVCTSRVAVNTDPTAIPARPQAGPCPGQLLSATSASSTTAGGVRRARTLRIGLSCVSGAALDAGCTGTATLSAPGGRRLRRVDLDRQRFFAPLSKAGRRAVLRGGGRVVVVCRDPAGRLLLRRVLAVG